MACRGLLSFLAGVACVCRATFFESAASRERKEDSMNFEINFLRRLTPAVVLFAAIFATCEAGNSQPVLTSIQDMVYLADGSRFNGLVYVEWKSFDTSNGAVIGQYNKVIRIVDGLLQVKLAPTATTTNAYYTAKFSSGGRVLFAEVWAVPQSTAVLKLRDIRAVLLPGGYVSGPSTVSGGTGGNTGGSIGADTSGSFIDAETPAGLVNGSNQVYTLAATPLPATTLSLYLNGVYLSAGVDYTITGNTITFIAGVTPQSGDVFRAFYRTGAIGGGPHSLLSDTHSDTFTEAVQRGDLIVGQGATTKWMRLPLGTANRCLVSNGLDAVWNACLFTGFTSGAVPFVSSSAILAQDASSFFWDATNKRLGLGTNAPTANLTIQASGSQGSTHFTRWLSSTGAELARMESDGSLVAQRLQTTTTSARAAWRDGGSGGDPTSKQNGDFWFNNAQQARKSYEAGQTHPLPQVLCSVAGGSTSATASTQLGSCTIPAFFLDAGDRLEVIVDYEHTGSASAFTAEFRTGSTIVWSRSFSASDSLATVRTFIGLYPSGLTATPVSGAWSSSSFGVTTALAGALTAASLDNRAAFTISMRGSLSTSSGDSLAIRNYTVIRYPAQFNP